MKIATRLGEDMFCVLKIINDLNQKIFTNKDIYAVLTEEDNIDFARLGQLTSTLIVKTWIEAISQGQYQVTPLGKANIKALPRIKITPRKIIIKDGDKKASKPPARLAPRPIEQVQNLSVDATNIAASIGGMLNQNQYYRDLMLDTAKKLAQELNYKLVPLEEY